MTEVSPQVNLAIMGLPGAGKSTQSQILSSEFGLVYASVSRALEEEIARATELGQVVSDYLLDGSLVPIDLVVQAILGTLEKAATSPGFVLDGFPRAMQAVLSLEEFLQQRGRPLSAFILLEVPEDRAITRLANRRICPECGAVQIIYDTLAHRTTSIQTCPVCGYEIVQTLPGELPQEAREPKAAVSPIASAMVRKRIQLYKENIGPVLQYYRGQGLLRSVDATGDVEDTTERIVEQVPDLRRLRYRHG